MIHNRRKGIDRIGLLGVLLVVSGMSASAAPEKKSGGGAAAKPADVLYTDGIAAIVGHEVITVSDVVAETAPVEQQMIKKFKGPESELRKQITDLRLRTADRLVERELIYLEFQSLKGQIPREVLQQRINSIISERAGGDRKRFERMLEARGMTMTEFEDKVRKDLAVEILMHEKVRRSVTISPSDVQAYYDQHKDEFILPAKVRLQMILLRKDGKWKGRIPKIVRKITAAVREGTPFDDLVKKYSEHASASSGGDLGWMKMDQMRADFAKAVAGLKTGEVSRPIDTAEGVVLLYVAERQGGKAVPLTPELRKRIERKLRAEEEQRRYRRWISELERKYFVRRYYRSAS